MLGRTTALRALGLATLLQGAQLAAACHAGTCGASCDAVSALTDDDCPSGPAFAAYVDEPRFRAGGDCWLNEATARECNEACAGIIEVCQAEGPGSPQPDR
jgi:hypothetical protein